MDLRSLQNELTSNLSRAERYRKIVGVVKPPLFILLMLWMIFVLTSSFTLPYLMKEGYVSFDAESQNLFIICFGVTIAVYMVLGYCFALSYKVFARIERETIARIIKELFPQAKVHSTPQLVSHNILRNSLFFNRLDNSGYGEPTIVFESLELPSESRTLNVVDIGIMHPKAGMSAMVNVYVEVFKQIFRSRAEIASYLFRGMFAWTELEKRIPGSILIVPDHIEDKLGYVAKHLQALKNRNDMKLTTLEDVEFERLFAVYSTDEVLARYILTPAMMVNITELRKKYGRDIMISFNANRFCIAVAMPNGFLSLRGKAIKNNGIVEEIYNDITTTQLILTQIKLDKLK